MTSSKILITGALVSVLAANLLAQSGSGDYSQWRGQTRDGSAAGFQAPTMWPQALSLKWKVEVGAGYAKIGRAHV